MTTNDPAQTLKHRDDPDDAVVFFDEAYAAFQNALRVTTLYNLDLLIANEKVRLCFAGDALVPAMARALQHHARFVGSDTPPALTICIWDGASTGNNIPNLPFEPNSVMRRGEVAGFQTGRIDLALSRFSDTLSLLDHERNLALFCTREARALPTFENASPLKAILYWWLRAHDIFFVHAGAVGNANGGVLLAGKGGSGKSTTALACLVAGMEYVSDDYCLVTAQPAPYAFNVYNSAKVTPNSLELLPPLQAIAAKSTLRADEKAVLFLDETPEARLVRGFPLRAILLPRVTGRAEPRLVPTLPNRALSALAISTLLQLPGAGDETLRGLGELTAQLPCFELELGNAGEVARVIGEWLAQA